MKTEIKAEINNDDITTVFLKGKMPNIAKLAHVIVKNLSQRLNISFNDYLEIMKIAEIGMSLEELEKTEVKVYENQQN